MESEKINYFYQLVFLISALLNENMENIILCIFHQIFLEKFFLLIFSITEFYIQHLYNKSR